MGLFFFIRNNASKKYTTSKRIFSNIRMNMILSAGSKAGFGSQKLEKTRTGYIRFLVSLIQPKTYLPRQIKPRYKKSYATSRARFLKLCTSVKIIVGICIHLEKLMKAAIPEDSWLKLSEKYLYPKKKSIQLENPNDRNPIPFSVAKFKANKDNFRFVPVLPERVIKLLKVNERTRTKEESSIISKELSMIEQLENCFTKEQFRKFGKVAWFDHFGPCRVLIREGMYADCFYVLLKGKINVRGPKGSTILGPGDCFGMKELLIDELMPDDSKKTARECTYVTQTYVEVVCVHRCDFESRQKNMQADVNKALKILDNHSPNNEPNPLKNVFSSEYLEKKNSNWNIRQLPPNFKDRELFCDIFWLESASCCFRVEKARAKSFRRLTKDLKNSEWVYIISYGILECSSEIPLEDFPFSTISWVKDIANADQKVKVGLASYLRGQALGISTCQNNNNYSKSKSNEDDFLEQVKFVEENVFLQRYPLEVVTKGETEILRVVLDQKVLDQTPLTRRNSGLQKRKTVVSTQHFGLWLLRMTLIDQKKDVERHHFRRAVLVSSQAVRR